ncbi:molybdenum cofactor biosynthesis protein MoaE [Halpernia frigidisoli]|nr:molybdenum cofactor biosynthesis protein MoaE [Halpernia frigidisoli]
MTKKTKQVFLQGKITPEFIAEMIQNHQTKSEIGAHNIFMGQVRKDVIEGKNVTALHFSCYEEMANKKLEIIREETFEKYHLTCMHIYHSLGRINVGEICLLVFVSAGHRPEVYEATEYIVNRVKSEVPIFGKEIFEDESHQWKKNI